MMKQPNSRDEYLKGQLISYIGNKRRLLPLIEEAMKELSGPKGGERLFIDPFSGSGVVSRLANTMGYRVISNDWEEYSCTLNRCYLLNRQDELSSLFKDFGGINSLIDDLNHLKNPREEDSYLARYYAPSEMDPEKVHIGKERLFYTRQNALILDRIRNEIERKFPRGEKDKERDLLMGPLLYLASKHTNTSGVFKAYHKGFGGYGKDALSRILHPIQMEAPVLWNGNPQNQVTRKDANKLIQEVDPCHILYLDPPYNQHQYGSNYHMLNTVALWDKIPQPLDFNDKGELARKAAIRTDWVNTRSDYCRKEQAENALSDLLEKAKSDYILISYSTDGIIPLDRMRSICEAKGRVRLLSNEYPVYRGGRQSSSRRVRNIEFLWVIDPAKKNSNKSRRDLSSRLIRREIQLLVKGLYPLEKLMNPGQNKSPLIIEVDSCSITLEWENLWTVKSLDIPENLTLSTLNKIKDLLDKWEFKSRQEEMDYLLEQIAILKARKQVQLYKVILKVLRKLAHPTSKEDFLVYFHKMIHLEETYPVLESCRNIRVELGNIAAKRMDLPKTVLIESKH